jgi:hypothetical protein
MVLEDATWLPMTSAGISTATAFWSYAHSDDDGSGGQIKRLKEGVDHAFKRHSGETLKSFIDRFGPNRLLWGDEWRSKISSTISGTTFFIAVISPSYLKSPNCIDEFSQFWDRAQASDLRELLLPILWVPMYPDTDEERKIWDTARERQYLDFTEIRKLDENSPQYKGLIDEMGERLAAAARQVATKPEVIDATEGASSDSGGDGVGATSTSTQEAEPPGLVDLYAEMADQSTAMNSNMQEAFGGLEKMRREVVIEPLHPSASAGQRLFFFKRVANEIEPYAEEFERKAKQSEEAARLLNVTMFNLVDVLSDPQIRQHTDYAEQVGRLREVPSMVQARLTQIDTMRSQVSKLGRMSRDLRVPFSAFERGFDSLDAILQLVADWSAALERLAE